MAICVAGRFKGFFFGLFRILAFKATVVCMVESIRDFFFTAFKPFGPCRPIVKKSVWNIMKKSGKQLQTAGMHMALQ